MGARSPRPRAHERDIELSPKTVHGKSKNENWADPGRFRLLNNGRSISEIDFRLLNNAKSISVLDFGLFKNAKSISVLELGLSTTPDRTRRSISGC
jgi:hypothetical protein